MRWPLLVLAVPAALLGLLALRAPAAGARPGARARRTSSRRRWCCRWSLLALGAGTAWWLWRRAPAADPAAALGRLRPVFAGAFYLDDVQDALVVRPVRALARRAAQGRRAGGGRAVEGTGTGATRLGGLLAPAHRAGLPRAAVAVLAGALLIGVAAALFGVTLMTGVSSHGCSSPCWPCRRWVRCWWRCCRPAPTGAARLVATVVAAVTLVLTVLLVLGAPEFGWFGHGPDRPQSPLAELDLPGCRRWSCDFHLGVDGISYPLVVLTALLTLLCCAYTLWRVPAGGRGRTLVALLLVLEVGILGTFLALDLVLFFVFFEVVAAADVRDDRRLGRRRPGGAAARKFVLYTLFGSVLLLVGVSSWWSRGRHRRHRGARPAAPGCPAAPSSPRSCCSRSRSR